MKTFYKISFLVLLTSLFFSCKKEIKSQEKQFTELQNAKWLIGKWENNSNEGNLSETWKMHNDSTFTGETYFVVKNDTVFTELISLEERNKKLHYVVTVPDQNQAKPVSFALISSQNNTLTFENPKHDFPTKIIYNQIGNDSLVAEISGLKKGKVMYETFKMKKAR